MNIINALDTMLFVLLSKTRNDTNVTSSFLFFILMSLEERKMAIWLPIW